MEKGIEDDNRQKDRKEQMNTPKYWDDRYKTGLGAGNGSRGRLYEFKLRTVIWDWAGEPVPDDIRDDLQAFLEAGVPDELSGLLTAFEVDAMLTRTRALVREGHFPVDPSGRRYPWPLV